jgi:hypothetical protein
VPGADNRLPIRSLVGAQQERLGDGEAKRLRRPKIDDHLKLRGQLYRQVPWLGAPEDAGPRSTTGSLNDAVIAPEVSYN